MYLRLCIVIIHAVLLKARAYKFGYSNVGINFRMVLSTIELTNQFKYYYGVQIGKSQALEQTRFWFPWMLTTEWLQ